MDYIVLSIGILMLLLGVIGGSVFLYQGLTIEVGEIDIVDCYDRHNNKIIGASCLDKPAESEQAILVVFGFMLIILGMVVGSGALISARRYD